MAHLRMHKSQVKTSRWEKRADPVVAPQSQARRFGLACALVACALAAIPLSDAIQPYVTGVGEAAELLGDDDEAQGGSSSADVDDASAESRAQFEEEVCELSGLADVRTNEDCSTVGFSLAMSTDAAFSQIAEELEAHGWLSVESGSSSMGSFVKEEGELTWLFLNCYGIGGETCVVVNVA